MASLGMQGPYDLTSDNIDKQVTKTSPGNYGLGYEKDGSFYPKYVGRADTDLKGRLKKWVSKYSKFKFDYATSPKTAFEKECKNYHDFGESKKLDNSIHPDRPDGSNWTCPVCTKYD